MDHTRAVRAAAEAVQMVTASMGLAAMVVAAAPMAAAAEAVEMATALMGLGLAAMVAAAAAVRAAAQSAQPSRRQRRARHAPV